MEFKGPYLFAMREQAPKMFNRLRRTGAMDAHLEEKTLEAHRMFDELTANAPKLPSGYPEDPWAREAEEQVFAILIDFPEESPEPTRSSSSPPVSEVLTPSEIERLSQRGREMSAYARKAFAHLGQAKKTIA